ncbi:hypothetical protein VM1G_07657 [Cytospora mali]|uniref:Uncharacterized protein n=1 Tax=Cytospora mali TaxID=578113 RepID=A0A194W8U8_CYTMA|nr:hypothetical protein VM1G_07657 [Valsa mali]
MADGKLSVIGKTYRYSSSAQALRATPTPPSPPPSSASSPSTLLSPSLLQHSASLPSSVLGALQALKANERGEYNGPSWLKFTDVTADDLEALISAAEPKIYKFRYDYDPTHKLLILRMPEGHPHVFVKNGIQQIIWEHLKTRLDLAMREEQDRGGHHLEALRSIKTAIKPLVEAILTLPDGTTKRPDIAFHYIGSDYPSLVVEVAHNIALQDQPIRTPQGQALDRGFELNVADFVPLANDVPRDVLEALTFSIPFSDLCDELVIGEEQQARQGTTPQPKAQKSHKRVHFSWSLPRPEADAERQSSDSEPSSSERRKIAVGERLYRGRRAGSGSARGTEQDDVADADRAVLADIVVNRTRSKTRSRTQQ